MLVWLVMSEFKSLTLRSNEIEGKYADLQNSFVNRSSKHTQAMSYLTEIVDLLIPRCNKLQSKTNATDPITGEARYGPTHVTKISNLCDKMKQMEKDFTNYIEKLENDGITSTNENEYENENDDCFNAKTTPDPAADAIYIDSSVFTSALGYIESSRLNEAEKTTMQKQEDIKNNPSLDPLIHVKNELKRILYQMNNSTKGVQIFTNRIL